MLVTRTRPETRAPRDAIEPGHDLPVLAAQLEPSRCVDWEALMEDGVPPTLFLGVDRRVSGPR